MRWLRGRWMPLTIGIAAAALLVTSVAWAGRGGPGTTGVGPGGGWDGHGAMMGMAGGGVAIAGDGPVRSLNEAERAAGRFAERWGLVVHEVMQFDNGFYAELAEQSGALATEVLVYPDTGTVRVEFGPAMMWNTAYGMHRSRAGIGDSRGASVGPGQARAIAEQWLRDHRSGESAGDAEPFPGYYTLHTLRGGQVTGMLSVNASTGAVWYHVWHGRFLAMSEEHDAD